MPRPKKVEQNDEFWTMKAPAWYSMFNGTEQLYDGSLDVKDGIALIPRDKITWVRRFQMNGYDFVFEADRDAFSATYNV